MFAENISGFFFGLLGSLFFFRCHDRLLLSFFVASSLLRHDVSPNSGRMFFIFQLWLHPDDWASMVWLELSDPSRDYTLVLLLPEWAVTLPVVSGEIKVGVLRHLHNNAILFYHSIPTVAFPSAP